MRVGIIRNLMQKVVPKRGVHSMSFNTMALHFKMFGGATNTLSESRISYISSKINSLRPIWFVFCFIITAVSLVLSCAVLTETELSNTPVQSVTSTITSSVTDGSDWFLPLHGIIPTAYGQTDNFMAVPIAYPTNTLQIDDKTGPITLLDIGDKFGASVTNIGDVDGNGVVDFAVGATSIDTFSCVDCGSVYLLLMSDETSIKSQHPIHNSTRNGPSLATGDKFGASVTNIGDVDGNGVVDFAVGAPGDNGGTGAVYIILMESDFFLKSSSFKIHGTLTNGPSLATGDTFGASVANIGDVNSDGKDDIVVGAPGDNGGTGAVYRILIDSENSISHTQKLTFSSFWQSKFASKESTNSIPPAAQIMFGASVANIGDMNRDGTGDIAVGSPGYLDTNTGGGAVFLMALNRTGNHLDAVSTSRIDGNVKNGPSLEGNSTFGSSVTGLGDIDRDGTVDIAVGDVGKGNKKGSSHLVFFNGDHSLRATITIDGNTENGPDVTTDDAFGSSISVAGDINGDGITGIVVGAPDYTSDGRKHGTVHLISLDVVTGTSTGKTDKTYRADLSGVNIGNQNRFGFSMAHIGDLNRDGVQDIVVGEPFVQGNSGLIQVLLMNSDGSVLKSTKISHGGSYDRYGFSVANIGDLDGDGINEIAVGEQQGDGVNNNDRRGVLWITSLNSNGSEKNHYSFKNPNVSGLNVPWNAFFGSSVTDLGEIYHNGTKYIAVGAPGSQGGTLHILSIQLDSMKTPSLNHIMEINRNTAGLSLTDEHNGFGASVTSIGDVDGNGIVDLAVGAMAFQSALSGLLLTPGSTGAVHILLLDDNGGTLSVKSSLNIDKNESAGPDLKEGDGFGASVISVGDLDGDGIPDIAAGAPGYDGGGTNRGAIFIIFLNSDGTIKETVEISNSTSKIPLDNNSYFGHSIDTIGDFDGDGIVNLAVGEPYVTPSNTGKGRFYILSLDKDVFAYGVSSDKADGNYNSGSVPIDVHFSEPVMVTGQPYLELETGTSDKRAAYQSGNETSKLRFLYGIQSGDMSTDLNYKSDMSLHLNGGAIKAHASPHEDVLPKLPPHDLVLDINPSNDVGSLAFSKDIIVDTAPPTVSIVLPLDKAHIPSEHAPFQANATDAIDGNIEDIRWSSSGSNFGTGSSITASLSLGDHTIMASATDLAGNAAQATIQVTVEDTSPPDVTGVSLNLDSASRTIQVDFDKTIDVTPVSGIDLGKFHIRGSGSDSGGMTLTTSTVSSMADTNSILIILTEAQRVSLLSLIPSLELDIDSGAVKTINNIANTANHDNSITILLDTTKPMLLNAAFGSGSDTNVLLVYFDETMDASATDLSKLSISNDDSNANDVSLLGARVITTTDDKRIEIELTGSQRSQVSSLAGKIYLNVGDNAFSDISGVGIASIVNTISRIDIPPVVTLFTHTTDPTSLPIIPFTALFSETITGLDVSDIVTSSGTVQNLTSLSGVSIGSKGTGNGQFDEPTGISANGTGHIFVADTLNNRIQIFDASGKYLDQFGQSGTGNGQFNRPQGIAINGTGHIFVADTLNNRIQIFDNTGSYLKQFNQYGESGQIIFHQPKGIAINSTGYVYVADTGGGSISVFDNTGSYLTHFGQSGTGNGQFNQPQGIAINSTGYVYVADTNNDRMQIFNALGTYVDKLDFGFFFFPRGIAINSTDHVYVVGDGKDLNPQQSRIQIFNSSGIFLDQFDQIVTNNGKFSSPQGIAFNPIGGLYVADSLNHRIQIQSNTYSFGVANAANEQTLTVNMPADSVQDTAGNNNAPSNTIRLKVDKTPPYLLLSAPFNQTNLSLIPFNVLFSESVDGFDTSDIRSSSGTVQNLIHPSLQFFGELGTSDGLFDKPKDITSNQTHIFVVDTDNDRIQIFDDVGKYLAHFGQSGTGNGQFNRPQGITINGTGHIFVADTLNDRIQIFDDTGSYLTHFGQSGTGNGQFDEPQDIAINSTGHIFVADTLNDRIQIFDDTGSYLSHFGQSGTGNGQFDEPTGISVNGTGHIFVADTLNGRIQIFDDTGSYLDQFGEKGNGPGQFNNPDKIAIDTLGYIYVADTNNHRIQVFDASGTYHLQFGSIGPDKDRLRFPEGITTNGTHVFVADTFNHRIQILRNGYFEITNPVNEQTLTVSISADSVHDNAGNGNVVSNTVSIPIMPVIPPGAPTGLTSSPGDAQVTLSWTAPSDMGDAAITDYVIEYSADTGTSWTTFSDGTGTATSAVVTGLTNGDTYIFRASAVNAAGTGPASDTAQATPVAPDTVAPSITSSATVTFAELVSNTHTITSDDPAATFAIVSHDIPGIPVPVITGHTLSWTPSEAHGTGGSYRVTVSATDSSNNVGTQDLSITVTETNSAPSLDGIGARQTVQATALSISLSAVDSDLPENTLTYTRNGTDGTITADDTRTATFTWTPALSDLGVHNVLFTVNDGNGGTDSEAIVITVITTNQAPVLTNPGPQTVTAGNTLSINLSATDDDGDDLTYTLSGIVGNAQIGSQSGVFSWTPTSAHVGEHIITIVVDDGIVTVREQVTFTVNAAPNPVLDPVGDRTITMGETLSIQLASTDTAGNGVFYTVITPPSGSTFDNNSGLFTWTPTAAGTFGVTFVVTGNAGGSVSERITITVNPASANNAPVLTTIGPQTATVGTVKTITLTATDADTSDVLVYSRSGTLGTINANVFTWTPTNTDVGSNTITFTVDDQNGGTATEDVVITVSAANRAPVLTTIGPQTATVGTVKTITLTATDADTSDVLVYSRSGTLGTINANVFTWTPTNTDVGSNTITFTVDDQNGGTATEDVVITVSAANRAPVLTTIGPQTATVGTVKTITLTATDADTSDVLVYSRSGTLGTINANVFTWTPTNTDVGSNTITFTVDDQNGGTATEDVVITVSAANRAPVLTTIGPQTATVGTVKTITLTATDADTSDVLVYSRSGTLGTINANVFTWTPTNTDVGSNTITFTVDDQNGGTATEDVVITVSAANRAPVLTTIGPQTATVGTVKTITLTATDADTSDVLVYSRSGTLGTINANVFTWTPTNTDVGSNTITFTVDDQNGGTATEDVVITVSAANRAPVLTTIGPQTATVGTVKTITLTATDADTSDVLVYSRSGTLGTINANVFTWTPTNTDVGSNTITFTVDDQNGGTATEDVVITVSAANRAPVLTTIGPQTATVGTVKTITLTATDADTSDVLVYSRSGTLGTINANVFTWTPTNTDVGSNTITFTVDDQNGGTATEDVVITVSAANRAPVLTTIGPQTATVGTVKTITLTATDADTSDVLVYSRSGTLGTINANVFTWTPTNTDVGSNTITFTVDDQNGGTATEDVVITVSAANRAPVLTTIGPQTATVGTVKTITLTATDADTSDVLVYSRSGTLGTINANVFTWTPTNTDVGSNTITFTVDDQNGGTATEDVVITVSAANRAPVLTTIGPQTATVGTVKTITLTATDADTSDVLVYSRSGTLGTINANVFTWTPTNTDVGSNTITFTVDDQNGGTATEDVVITVSAANRAPVLTTIGPQTATVGTVKTITLTATDADTSDVLVYSRSGTLGTINANVFTWTPTNTDVGSNTITFTVDDQNGGTATEDVVITVSAPAPTTTVSRTSIDVTEGQTTTHTFSSDGRSETTDDSNCDPSFAGCGPGTGAWYFSMVIDDKHADDLDIYYHNGQREILQGTAVHVIPDDDGTLTVEIHAKPDTKYEVTETVTVSIYNKFSEVSDILGINIIDSTFQHPESGNSFSVPADWPLVPNGVSHDESFRLMFSTSEGIDGKKQDKSTYDRHVQRMIKDNTIHTPDHIADQYTALVQTRGDHDIKTNTNTASTHTDAPIYWMGGSKVADDYDDFYDGSWDAPRDIRTESGEKQNFGNANYHFNGIVKKLGHAKSGGPYTELKTNDHGGKTITAIVDGVEKSYTIPSHSNVPIYSTFVSCSQGYDYGLSHTNCRPDASLPIYGLSPVLTVSSEQTQSSPQQYGSVQVEAFAVPETPPQNTPTTADPALIQAVKGYLVKAYYNDDPNDPRGIEWPNHLPRWLPALAALTGNYTDYEPMTSEKAFQNAKDFDPVKWIPVAEEILRLEQAAADQ